MRLFRRKSNPELDLAKAIAKGGISGRTTVVRMQDTGQQKDGGAKEVEFTLTFTPEGGSEVTTVLKQFMNRYTLHGLGPGELARIIYDRNDPTKVMIEGHVRY